MSPPLELAAVQRDDALLDRVALRLPIAGGTDPVAVLLTGWVADICDEEGSPPAEVIRPVGPSARRRSSRPAIVGLIAAAVLVSVSGVAVAATRASPGSVLWPVTRMVASHHAHSMLARERVLRSLAVAQRQAAQGNAAAARVNLDEARSRVDEVQPVDGKSSLQARLAALQAALNSSGAGSAPPDPAGSGTAAQSPPAEQPSPIPSPSSDPSPSPGPSPSAEPTPSPDPSPTGSPAAVSAGSESPAP